MAKNLDVKSPKEPREANDRVINLDDTWPMKILLQNSFTFIEIYGTKPWCQATQGAKESEASTSVTNLDSTLPMKILLQNSFTFIEIYGTKPWCQVTQGAKGSQWQCY
jgi:hypothetical protein